MKCEIEPYCTCFGAKTACAANRRPVLTEPKVFRAV